MHAKNNFFNTQKRPKNVHLKNNFVDNNPSFGADAID